MGNIIQLENSRFKFQTRVVRYLRNSKDGEQQFEKAIIVLKEISSERCRVHEFTEFIIKRYGKRDIKTQIDYAGKLVAFLNLVLSKRLKSNFKLLDFDDVHYFMQKKALEVEYGTYCIYKRVIVEFYEYLVKKKWLINITKEDFVITQDEKNSSNFRYDINLDNIDIDSKKLKKRNTHIMGYKLQALFLQVAIEEVNQIAFGVALQMFGGLRQGELVNLTHSAIQCIGPFGRYGMLLRLEDRHLRNDLNGNQAKGYVKKPRKQQVISPYGILEYLYKQHTKKYLPISELQN